MQRQACRAVTSIALLSSLLLLLMGCSGGGKSPVSPGMDGSGHGLSGDPSGGYCEQAFEVDYVISVEKVGWPPLEIETDGQIVIRDDDCPADESSVVVHFAFNGPSPTECEIPGEKSTSGDTATYQGEKEEFVEKNPYHTYRTHDEFELVTTPDPEGGFLIEGWYHRHRTDWWSTGIGNPVESHSHWHCTINGKSIAIELEVGEIQGPDALDEYAFADYSITAAGDTGITYRWTVDPSTSALFYEPEEATTTVRLAGVHSDTTIILQCIVSSDNYGPIVRTLAMEVADVITTAPNLREVDFLPMTLVSVVDDTYTFEYEGPVPPVGIGDMIVGSVDLGYLRHVNQMLDDGTTLVLETSQATLEEAIYEGTLAIAFDFTGDHSGDVHRTAEGIINVDHAFSPITIDFLDFIPGGILYSGGPLTLQMTQGTYTLKPRVTFYMDSEWEGILPEIYEIDTSVEGETTLTLHFLATLAASYDKDGSKKFPGPIFPAMLGPIPVALRVSFYVGWGAGGEGEANMQTGFTFRKDLGADLRYDQVACSSWCLDSYITPTKIEPTQPTITAKANAYAMVYAKPEFEFIIAGLVSTGIDVKPYIKLELDADYTSDEDWCVEYDLLGGVSANAFVRATIFSSSLPSAEGNLIDKKMSFCDTIPSLECEPIGPGCGPVAIAKVLTPPPFFENVDIEFDGSESHDDIEEWAWDWENDGDYDFFSDTPFALHSFSVWGQPPYYSYVTPYSLLPYSIAYVQLRVTDEDDEEDNLDDPLQLKIFDLD